MIELVIIADDLTGALDTGVQFAKQHIPTLVTGDKDLSFKKLAGEIKVLAVNTESRHDEAGVAYDKVMDVAKAALRQGAKYLYKKTDSALRGNIGTELEALWRAADIDALPFIPAYPDNKRTTEMGRQYIDGVPVEESVFGNDPFSPVVTGVVAEIIRLQSDVPISNMTTESKAAQQKGIVIYDAVSNADLKRIGEGLKAAGRLKATAGCAGFAAYLPGLTGIEAGKLPALKPAGTILIVSGSVNDITIRQTEYAKKNGIPAILISEPLLFNETTVEETRVRDLLQQVRVSLEKKKIVLLQTINDRGGADRPAAYIRSHGMSQNEVRARIKKNVGSIVGRIISETPVDTLVVFGGDTLAGIMDALGCSGIVPVAEIDRGITLGKPVGSALNIVAKSGGFGSEDIIETLVGYTRNRERIE